MKYFIFTALYLLILVSVSAQETAYINTSQRELGYEEAGRRAAAASAELRAGRAILALREGSWMMSIRAFLPSLSFTVSEDDRLSLINADSFIKTYSINVEQLLFDGGRTRTARSIERTELALLSAELKRNESAVIEAALSIYRQILFSRMIIAIREEALVSLYEQQRILLEELRLGLVIPLDIVHADITVREAELEFQAMKLQLDEQESQFIEMLGLEEMPLLSEQADIYRSPPQVETETIHRSALSRNPDLRRLIHSIMQKEAEAKFSSRNWIPTIQATGSYSVSGQQYPLNRQSWSIGLAINFASPWFGAGIAGNTGWEWPYDRTARVQTSLSPLPDPVSAMSARQARLALILERENYQLAIDRLGREAALAVHNLYLSEQQRILAVETLKLGAERYRLSEVLLSLGRITRIELMEERLQYSRKEVSAVEAAIALLEAERHLERLIDLPPGILERFLETTTNYIH